MPVTALVTPVPQSANCQTRKASCKERCKDISQDTERYFLYNLSLLHPYPLTPRVFASLWG